MKKKQLFLTISLIMAFMTLNMQAVFVRPVVAADLDQPEQVVLLNATPTADPQEVLAISGFFTPITLTGSDPEGDALTYFIIDYPSHGTLYDEEAPNLEYRSETGYDGPDSFTFMVSDGATESAPAMVSITVSAN